MATRGGTSQKNGLRGEVRTLPGLDLKIRDYPFPVEEGPPPLRMEGPPPLRMEEGPPMRLLQETKGPRHGGRSRLQLFFKLVLLQQLHTFGRTKVAVPPS